jgi:hypothetical protein
VSVKGWAGGKGELGPTIETGSLPGAWVHEPLPERRVLGLARGCRVETLGRMAYGAKCSSLGSFVADALGGIERPAGYARVVPALAAVSRADRPGF